MLEEEGRPMFLGGDRELVAGPQDRQVPDSELDAAGLSEGFVGFVDERLTRPELATRLEQRLRGRASEDEETVQRRFNAAKREIEHYGLFDYVLVNEELEDATRKLISIFLAEECRRSRVAALAEQFLAEGRLRSSAAKPSVA